MANWLSRNADWFAPTLVAVIAVIVALLVYRWERKPKTLDYSVLSSGALVSGAKNLQDLDVFFDGTPVNEPNVVVIRIMNTGKTYVEAADFVDVLQIEFENTIKVIDATQIAGSANNMVGPVAMNAKSEGPVKLVVSLLNRREFFDLQFLVDGKPGRVSVSSRFNGQSRPMERRETSDRYGGPVQLLRDYPGTGVYIVAVALLVLLTALLDGLVRG